MSVKCHVLCVRGWVTAVTAPIMRPQNVKGRKMLTTKSKQSWVIPAVLLALMALLVWVAPIEQSLGQGIKIVYVHVGLIWAGMLGFALNGLLGLVIAVTGSKKLADCR